jgi:predicted regulator of Ras-like GTPase activity (Roadblock/LC7/MglB family)
MSPDSLEPVLQELLALPGTLAIFVGDSEGSVLAAAMRSGEQTDEPSSPVRSVARMLAGLRSLRRSSPQEIDLVFQQGRILVRPIKDRFLALQCERQLNLPLLTMALDEAVKRLAQLFAGQLAGEQAVSADVQALIQIAREMLGERAGKVVEQLESSGGSREELSLTIERVGEITRLFIDDRNAKEMARRMRAALFNLG